MIRPCWRAYVTAFDITRRTVGLVFNECVHGSEQVNVGHGDGQPRNFRTRSKKKKPIEEYLKHQARFKHLTEKNIKEIQKDVDSQWEYLQRLCGMWDAPAG